ncbi:Uncharacterised protein [Candidatus Ornithobacterium hominis]|uniref:hypothetical protein n=1 Tax=Candidatus Ornithobacterium hominis TaxID=2497989 RepID=UPI000E950B1E|nr:hypothetical protein [Candidatus Ornithobacterium hominis]SZD72130.1 Uncharacterised protein [Candidatus Ornithobacterium hominis]
MKNASFLYLFPFFQISLIGQANIFLEETLNDFRIEEEINPCGDKFKYFWWGKILQIV